MSFIFDSITAGIRDSTIEGFLADIDGSPLEARVVALAEISDQTGPSYFILNDTEYVALTEATVRQIKKIK